MLVYVCLYVHTCVYVYLHICVCIYVCIDVHVYVGMHVSLYVSLCPPGPPCQGRSAAIPPARRPSARGWVGPPRNGHGEDLENDI